jgi:hypothetical protein
VLLKGTASAKGKQAKAIKYALCHKVLPYGHTSTASVGAGVPGSDIHIAQSWGTQIPGI